MQRPAYHFAPEKNWMNDPNGTVFDGTFYHLFYQYNPFGSEWGNIHWGYACSRDLVHWERCGVRLAPRREEGEEHCFSGCAFPYGGGYKLAYTSVGFGEGAAAERAVQVFCNADGAFARIERRAVLGADANPFPVREWRDPFLFSYGKTVFLLLAGRRGGRGGIFYYTAADGTLERWTFGGELFGRDGALLECPNAVLFGERMLLLYSLGGGGVRYAAGDFDGKSLAVREEGDADCGDAFYATNLSGSACGKPVLFGWLRETASVPAPGGWYSGCLALPRTVELRGYTPVFRPVPTLSQVEGGALPAGAPAGRAHISLQSGQTLTLCGGEGEFLRFTAGGGTLRAERRCAFAGAAETPLSMPCAGGAEIYTDGTAVEAYAGGRAMSLRWYGQPLRLPAEGGVFAHGMNAARFTDAE